MSSAADYINQITEYLKKAQKQTSNLWNTSTYFRVISVATTSITASLIARNLYITYSRKYHNMPDGPKGLPFIGSAQAFRDPETWKTIVPLAKYGPIATLQLGQMSCITISNPYLCRKIYSDPRTLDNPNDFIDTDEFLTTANGESWAKRRKIIFANIMSTMKASFVEDSTKNFITNKIFSVCDINIKNNATINMRNVFRAIGFNIVLHACFGKEINSLQDPFWKTYENKLTEMRQRQNIRLILFFIPKKARKFLLTLFGMKSIEKGFDEINDIIEEFAVNNKHKIPIKYDKNVKLYNDYVEDYMSSDHNNNKINKLTRKHLLGDMSIMIQASTDTTYMGLGFAMLQAAKNQNIQQELYIELKNAFGDINNFQLTNDGIFKIPKLRAFVHEVLRIHSPAAIGGFRKINVDGFKIDTRKFGGNKVYNVPKGCNIMMNIMAISHEPKWWIKNYDCVNNEKHKCIDMNKIHMDWWIDQNGKFDKRQHSDLFLIFSRGKRDCIGQSLAMKVLYIAIAMIFMKYKVYGPNGDDNFQIKQTTEQGVTILPNTIKLVPR